MNDKDATKMIMAVIVVMLLLCLAGYETGIKMISTDCEKLSIFRVNDQIFKCIPMTKENVLPTKDTKP